MRRCKQAKGKDVYTIGRSTKFAWGPGPSITFSEEESTRLQHPHDDPLIVTVMIIRYRTRRVLVDNDSFVDIFYLSAFKQMKITKENLQPIGAPLIGFTGDKIFPLGLVTLPITAGLEEQQVTKEVTFLVVNCPSAYNAILGRPSLNQMRVVTSTYHLMMKFPT